MATDEFKRIESFTVDHTRLLRGLYVSRVDKLASGNEVTTFDVRMTEPRLHQPLPGTAMHTIEHLAATWLRNNPDWARRILYWGPMGCRTGFYLLMQGNLKPEEILDLMRGMFRFIADFEGDVPGVSEVECGNASYHDLAAAKAAAKKYLDEVLTGITPAQMNYPK